MQTASSVTRSIAGRLAECELRVVLAESCTAGLASAMLARVPGISDFHCGSAVTYRNATKAAWLGVDERALDDPGPVSRIVAEQMAAGVLRKTPEADLGVSVTGHLGPNAPPELDGLAYAGLARRAAGEVQPLEVHELRLQSTTRLSRQKEAALRVLQLLDARLEKEAGQIESLLPRADWRDLLAGEVDAVCLEAGSRKAGRRDERQAMSGVVFPGAFNPPHEGHFRMARIAGRLLRAEVEFELSIDNVDKPSLRRSQAARRLERMLPHGAVWLTRAPTFREKSQLFPGATFVVGADTMQRIADPRYYGGAKQRNRAVAQIRTSGCRFLIFGRTIEGAFRTLADMRLLKPLRELCEEVAAEQFRADVSSTELRRRHHAGD